MRTLENVCLAFLLTAAYVPETANPGATASTNVFESYRALLGCRTFLAFALTATGAHAGFHIFAAGAPSVLIGTFNVRPEAYGLYATLPPMGFLLGSFLSNRLTSRFELNQLIAIGGGILISGGISIVAFAVWGYATPVSIVGPMVVICCGSGLVTPNAVAGGIGAKPEAAGAASGLLSFMQIAGAAGATTVASFCDSASPLTLALLIASVGGIAMLAFAGLAHRVHPSQRGSLGKLRTPR